MLVTLFSAVLIIFICCTASRIKLRNIAVMFTRPQIVQVVNHLVVCDYAPCCHFS